MKRSVIIILLLLFPISFAEAVENFNDHQELTISLDINGEFTLENTGSNPNIEEAKVFLTLIPQNDVLQKARNSNYYSSPTAQIIENPYEIEFNWNNPEIGNFNFGINTQIETTNAIVIVDEKIPFPLEERIQEYTSETEFIDINQNIRELAQSLAEGEDDLYVVSIKIADWVEKNIEYNLTTLTADVVQKSSWVLENKEGVCDELTNLYISLLRSLGIPSRFVSGIAYSNLDYTWGPHGWAEVYFPDKGWVPFDVTYRQFGWIDPSHIKLKVNEDSGDASLRYSWRSRDVQLTNQKINISAELLSRGEKVSPMLFTIKPLINNVGPSSYVPIEIEIPNEKDYYFPRTFTITKAPELIGDNIQTTLLKPLETNKIFWLIKIPEDVENNYIYKTKIEVKDQFHTNQSTEITYSKKLKIVTLEEAQTIIEASKQIENKITSRELEVNCNSPRYAFTYETINIECNLINKGNINLKNIETCYEDNCQTTNLGITEENKLIFPLNLEIGMQNLEFTSTFNEDRASDIVTINILENPDLTISFIEYPEQVSYKDEFNISLTLSIGAPVKNISVGINNQNVLNIPELEDSQTAIILAKGKEFIDQEKIIINLKFEDENNKDYKLDFNYPIQVINIPWYVQFLRWIKIA